MELIITQDNEKDIRLLPITDTIPKNRINILTSVKGFQAKPERNLNGNIYTRI
jgi:hypothetical protein